MLGWIAADLAYQGLVEAGPEFDRAKVIAATNTLTAYSADGLINPIDWSRQHVPPTQDDPKTHGSSGVRRHVDSGGSPLSVTAALVC
jgi:hypothetical protein